MTRARLSGTLVAAAMSLTGCNCGNDETIVCCERGDVRALEGENACASGGRAEPAATCALDASVSREGGLEDASLDGGGLEDASLDGGGLEDASLEASLDASLDGGSATSCLLAEAADDQLQTVALSGDGHRVVVGAEGNDGAGLTAGHARVFERTLAGWTQLGADLDGEAADDRFGHAVAISRDGMRIAVGGYLNDAGGGSAGHVRVFEWSGSAWAQLGVDLDGPGAFYGFGSAVALSADGARLVVGAPGVTTTTGRVFVYELTAGAWVQLGTRIEGNSEDGTAVDISEDGLRIAVGAPSSVGATGNRARVHEWSGTDWVGVGGELLGEAAADGCGTAVALSGDGSMIAVGAPSNDEAGFSAGHVRVYRFGATGWRQVGADLDGATREGLGTSVGLSADGDRLITGGPAAGGSARMYTLVSDAWVLATTPTFGTGGREGTTVAISADGTTLGVGAPYAFAGDGEVCLYDVP